jgi:hypothetical protein
VAVDDTTACSTPVEKVFVKRSLGSARLMPADR